MPSEDVIGPEDVRRYLAGRPNLPPAAAGVAFLARGARAITNEETLDKSRRYLAPGFLRDLFPV